jgi:hypothetical protein
MAKTKEAITTATTEALVKSQEVFAKTTEGSEKVAQNLIDYNTAIIKSGEVMIKKAYDNYLSNVAASFDAAKALTKTTDVAEFYKVSSSNFTTAAEKFSAQGKELTELSAKALKDNAETAKKLYTKAFAA